jgi:hypothetical protein
MHYLYLPVVMPGHRGVRLPERLQFLRPIVDLVCAQEDIAVSLPDYYVYVTARRGWASPDNPLNRPGWHSDGFGTNDVNYIWADRFPTRFAIQEFVDISDNHVDSLRQFEEQSDEDSVVVYPDCSLLRLDPEVIHATPVVPPPGGERSFFKISVSSERYNLAGNSHNYLFDYEWRMWSRSEIRNDPNYAGGDAGPQS